MNAEQARAAAEWLAEQNMRGAWEAPVALRAEADRLERAAKTPGQVLAEAFNAQWHTWTPGNRSVYEQAAAAVVAHVVGPDRVVVDRADLQFIVDYAHTPSVTAEPGRSHCRRLREALS